MSKLKPTSRKSADLYETTIDIFESLFREMKEIGKKKPDMVVTKLKISHINRLLSDIKICLTESPEAKYLDLLDDETLPQASDAIVIMAQYEGALEAFHKRHHGSNPFGYGWYFEDGTYGDDDD